MASPAAFAMGTPFRVVIDPGHGGNDRGTVYENGHFHIAEKDVTLVLARRVAAELAARGMSVTLTRDRDTEISLPDRTAIANRIHADIFLSIHMNTTSTRRDSGAQGIETYILNTTSDASSKRLEHLENAVLGGSVTAAASGDNMDVALILKDLRLDANLTQSERLACRIQNNLVRATSPRWNRSRNRGVKQALFHVLLGADMPSVLVEAGFLSSAYDRGLVLSPSGQKRISHAIADAVEQFQKIRGTPISRVALSRCKVR